MKEKGITPESTNEALKRRRRTLLAAHERFEKEGYQDQDIWFLRGISVQQLQSALKTGKFTGQGPRSMFGALGDIWAAPIVERIHSPFLARYEGPETKDKLDSSYLSLERAREMAAIYALGQARLDAMIETVGITSYDKEVFELMWEIEVYWDDGRAIVDELRRLQGTEQFSRTIEKLSKKMGSEKALADALEKALSVPLKGIILGIHKDVLDRAKVVGIEDDGVRIGVGRGGLLLKNVSVIEAVGEDGKQYFEQLKTLRA